LREFNLQACKEWYAKLTKNDKIWLSMDRGSLTEYDPTLIKDPRLSWAISLAGRNLRKLETERRVFDDGFNFNWTSPLDNYPLAETSYYGYCNKSATMVEEHKYIYFNAIYVAERQ
jgi:hypothetical protein